MPELKITLEHITTKDATEYVKNCNHNLAASITPHHLSLSRNDIFDGGIKPHNYCLPILKREIHRKSLVKAAISGNSKFFLGTDTAPHLIQDKESDCGCAGIFNATYCIPILTQLFDNEAALGKLENFVSKNGAKHYNLKLNREKLKLVKTKTKLVFEQFLNFNLQRIRIFEPNFPIFWKVVSN